MTTTNDERLGLPSASGFHVLANCSGQPNKVAALPPSAKAIADDNKQVDAATRGELLHNARQKGSPEDLTDEDDLKAYANGMRMEREVLDAWLDSLPVSDAAKADMIVTNEKRLWLNDPTTLEPVFSGRLDVYYRVKDEAGNVYVLIVDWKTGFAGHTGSAADNWQLRSSSVLVRNEYDALQTRVSLIKPDRGRDGVHDEADYNSETLGMWEYAIHYHLWMSKQANAPRRAGDWCFFCPARGYCEEAGILTLMPTYVPPEKRLVAGKERAIEWAKNMPINDALMLFERRRLINQVLDAVTGRLKALPADELDRLGLVRTQGRRTDQITNMTKARDILMQAVGVTEEELNDASKFNKEALVALVMKVTGGRKQSASNWIDMALDKCTTRSRGEPSLKEMQ